MEILGVIYWSGNDQQFAGTRFPPHREGGFLMEIQLEDLEVRLSGIVEEDAMYNSSEIDLED
jgi:hypothetical protein